MKEDHRLRHTEIGPGAFSVGMIQSGKVSGPGLIAMISRPLRKCVHPREAPSCSRRIATSECDLRAAEIPGPLPIQTARTSEAWRWNRAEAN